MLCLDLNNLTLEPLSHDPEVFKQVALRLGSVPHLTQLAQTRIAPGRQLTPHRHADMHEIFVVLAGSGEARTETQTVQLTPGVCVHIQPQELHAFSNTGPQDLVLLYFGVVE